MAKIIKNGLNLIAVIQSISGLSFILEYALIKIIIQKIQICHI